MTPKELGYTNSPFESDNSLIEHVRRLNIREKREHDEKREKAIARIKELRQRIRLEQEASASADTIGHIS